MRKAFSLVEVMVVLTLMLLLAGLAIWAFSGSSQRELLAKVRTDLIRIDSAKASWRADHPQDPALQESDFPKITSYLGLQAADPITIMFPSEYLGGQVVYFMGSDSSPASAANLNTGKHFNPVTGKFE